MVPSEAAPAATAVAVGWPDFLASAIPQLARQHLLSALSIKIQTHSAVDKKRKKKKKKKKRKEYIIII